MGGLFDHARKLIKGFSPPTPAAPQRFRVACPEGHVISGYRTEGYQALRCPDCGVGVFVLPRSPLPDPAGSATARTVKPAARVSAEIAREDEGPVALTDPKPMPPEWDEPGAVKDADDEIQWVDEAEPPARAIGDVDPTDYASEEIEVARARAASKPTPRAPASSTKEGKSPRVGDGRRPRAGGRDEPEPEARPRRSPLRAYRIPLLFLGMATAIGLTVAYRSWRAGVQELPRIFEVGRTEGLEALDAGKFDLAHQLLADARRAVDRLHDDSEAANAVRQGAMEAEIITGLAQTSLELMLDEASRAAPADWASTFKRNHQGRGVILEATIAKAPDTSGRGSYELDYHVFAPGEGRAPRSVGTIDLTGFRLFEMTKPRVGDHVLFGAKLGSFKFDAASEQWRIGLDPESGVTMLHRKALSALGFPDDGEPAAPENEP